VLVCYDFLGLFRGFVPRFVKRYAELGEQVLSATQSYVAEVRSGAFPDDKHSFGVKVTKDDKDKSAAPSESVEARYASAPKERG
jgi:3-methyl-2-oxobutanoate hydroxymethyltransferase